ncbi:YbaB/EbfC family nucleoid-associated protein [bacterium]|nr:YbaB/EbfC family nucleoid-associated protein [bacterium]
MNIFKKMQQVKSKMAEAQAEAQKKIVESSVGGGMVRAVANGAQEVIEIKIDKQVIENDDVEMLEDLVLSAVNDALRKSRELMAQEMAKFAKDLGVPPQLLGQM